MRTSAAEVDEGELYHRSRTGALVAHAYELIDRGPELDRDALVTMICERALALAGAATATLWTVDANGVPRYDRYSGARPSATAIWVERALVGLIAEGGDQMVNSAEAPLLPGIVQRCDQLERERSGAVCVGLKRRDELLGVLCLHRIGAGSFESWEAADAERFGKFAALALHQMTLRERAERDEVTGMPGRTLLLDALEKRLGSGEPFDERDQVSLDSRCGVLEAALDRADVPPELASSYLGVSVGAALANGSTKGSTPTPAGALFTAAESAMRDRKKERRRSQGRDADDRS